MLREQEKELGRRDGSARKEVAAHPVVAVHEIRVLAVAQDLHEHFPLVFQHFRHGLKRLPVVPAVLQALAAEDAVKLEFGQVWHHPRGGGLRTCQGYRRRRCRCCCIGFQRRHGNQRFQGIGSGSSGGGGGDSITGYWRQGARLAEVVDVEAQHRHVVQAPAACFLRDVRPLGRAVAEPHELHRGVLGRAVQQKRAPPAADFQHGPRPVRGDCCNAHFFQVRVEGSGFRLAKGCAPFPLARAVLSARP
mmetsp:Transcript_13480/g.26619  ORF Transcript_13480/g.26619 Transcript_13480/m.26619 type:complete len:248 (-) Transcript_13480:221-964(-)